MLPCRTPCCASPQLSSGPPAPFSPAPAVWLDPRAYGGCLWPRPRRRPPPRDPSGGPAFYGSGEGRAEAAQGPACLPAPSPFPLLRVGKTPLDTAQSMKKAAAAALLEADPRVAAALAAEAGKV